MNVNHKLNCLWMVLLLSLSMFGCKAPVQKQDLRESISQAIEEQYDPMLVVPLPLLEIDNNAGTPLSSLSGKNVAATDLLLSLFKDSDINLLIDADATGTLSFDVKNTTVEAAFEAFLRDMDLTYEWDGNFMRIKNSQRGIYNVDLINASSSNQSGGSSGQSSGGSGGSGGDPWSMIENDLQSIIGEEGSFITNRIAGIVEVEARPSILEKVDGYLERVVDRITNQVSIEARILEVRLTDEFRIGVNWSILPGFLNSSKIGTLAGGAIATQTAASGGTAFNFGLLNDGDFSVFVDALEEQGQVRVLSSPRVSTMNNMPATIRVVDQIPVIDRESIDSAGGIRTEFDIRFVEAGVSVTVTPQIGSNGMVTVQVLPSITEQTGTVVTPDGSLNEPILSTRETSTSIQVPDGQVIVIGGLRSTRKSETVTGVPLLSSIPLLGRLFESTTQESEEVELMLLLQPRVIDRNWISEEVRRGTHRMVYLRRPFRATTLQLNSKPEEEWNTELHDDTNNEQERSNALEYSQIAATENTSDNSLTVSRNGLAQQTVKHAQDQLEAGNIGQARSQMMKALKLDPSLIQVRILMAILASHDGDYQVARKNLDKVLSQDQDNSMALTARGLTDLQSGSPHSGLNYLKRAHSLASSSLTANNLAAALLGTGNPSAARELLEGIASDSNPGELYANLAFAQLQTDQAEMAKESLQAALRHGADARNPRVIVLTKLIERALAKISTVKN